MAMWRAGIFLPRNSIMSDVVNFKPKKTGLVRLENGELSDFDAWLAERGLGRTMINELYADRVTNEEKEAPDVAKARTET
jgi:hypothetical protein